VLSSSDAPESSISPSAVLVSGKEIPKRVSSSGRWVAVSVIMTSSSTSLQRLTGSGCSVLISVVVKSSSKAMEVVLAEEGDGASLTTSKVVFSSCL